jgi:hypothetical protein
MTMKKDEMNDVGKHIKKKKFGVPGKTKKERAMPREMG